MSGEEAVNHTASTFTFDDIASLETQATRKPAIDILITSQWPSAICNFAKKPVSFIVIINIIVLCKLINLLSLIIILKYVSLLAFMYCFQEGYDVQSSGSSMISRLSFKLRPRYHFSGSEGVYYERLPYRLVSKFV